MPGKYRIQPNLNYLQNTPGRINWRVIAGPPLHSIQMYDLIYDEIDLKIRQRDTPKNLKKLRELQA